MTPDELTRRVLARLPARRLPVAVRYGGWGALVVASACFTVFRPEALLGLAALVVAVLVSALGE